MICFNFERFFCLIHLRCCNWDWTCSSRGFRGDATPWSVTKLSFFKRSFFFMNLRPHRPFFFRGKKSTHLKIYAAPAKRMLTTRSNWVQSILLLYSFTKSRWVGTLWVLSRLPFSILYFAVEPSATMSSRTTQHSVRPCFSGSWLMDLDGLFSEIIFLTLLIELKSTSGGTVLKHSEPLRFEELC